MSRLRFPSARLQGWSACWLSSILALACSAGSEGGGSSTTGGTGASAGSAGSAGSGGIPTAGASGSSTAGSNAAGASGAGVGGSSGTSTGGAGGSTAGGAGGAAGSGGTAPTGVCPSNASFCSGFEQAGIPAGASYRPAYQAADWMNFMAVQNTVVRAGSQALEVKLGGGGYEWKMLSVPAPGPTFWVRLYMRSSVDVGQAEHNAYFQAMTGDGEPNTGDNVEVAEQYCQVVLNLHDDVVVSVGGMPMCGTGVPPLPKDTWHCMEAFFDGPNGAVQVFANGNKIIDKTAWTRLTFATFSFGYLGFHGPARTMWYDDVAVAPARIGCAP